MTLTRSPIPVKACPWCGESATLHGNATGWVARCGNENCPVIARTELRETAEEAARDWNERQG